MSERLLNILIPPAKLEAEASAPPDPKESP
jgi:hypothetical protein